jgi:hypothetical protein
MSKTISAGRTPKILLETIGGDLSLVGWEGEDILLKGDDDEIRFKQDGDKVTISCDDDISIRVPKASLVYINMIGGDASIRGVVGGIELKEIAGDLSIRDVESVAIDTIQSDFSLRGAKGHLSVKNAQSDVSIRDVRGNVSANVSEDVVLYLNPRAGNVYSVTAGDDILLVMPPKANATLTLNADEIDVEWKGIPNDADATSRVITLGDGSALITLKAGGDIRVSNQADAGDSAEDFGNFAGMGFDWSGFGVALSERISRQVEQATRGSTRKAEEAARQAARKAEEAERRVNRRGRPNWDVSPKGVPMPPKPQVSEEERMAILKMLQEKKITAEEADNLLAALEGGS